MKNLISKISMATISLALLGSMISCSSKDDDAALVKTVEPLVVQIEDLDVNTVKAGETLQIDALVIPKDADQKLEWASSDEAIATVDAKGLVTAVAKGNVTIKASAINGLSAKVKLVVTPSDFFIADEMVGQFICVKLQARYIDNGHVYGEDEMDQLFKMAEGETNETFCAKIKASLHVKTVKADNGIVWGVGLASGETKDVFGVVKRNDAVDNAFFACYDIDNAGINFGERAEDYRAVKMNWLADLGQIVYDEPGGSFYDFIFTCTLGDAASAKATKHVVRVNTKAFEKATSLR